MYNHILPFVYLAFAVIGVVVGSVCSLVAWGISAWVDVPTWVYIGLPLLFGVIGWAIAYREVK